jgi:hypothetical protein
MDQLALDTYFVCLFLGYLFVPKQLSVVTLEMWKRSKGYIEFIVLFEFVGGNKLSLLVTVKTYGSQNYGPVTPGTEFHMGKSLKT